MKPYYQNKMKKLARIFRNIFTMQLHLRDQLDIFFKYCYFFSNICMFISYVCHINFVLC